MVPAHLLLVDDNPQFLGILRRFLQQYDDLVVLDNAFDSNEAIAKARRLNPDVILLDLSMKGDSGLETIPRLRADMPHVRIVVLTLWDTAAYRHAALAQGADGFVSKVAMNVDLLPAIRNTASRRHGEPTPAAKPTVSPPISSGEPAHYSLDFGNGVKNISEAEQ
jgi:DNA-binding NarL/FixJ family response regulator